MSTLWCFPDIPIITTALNAVCLVLEYLREMELSDWQKPVANFLDRLSALLLKVSQFYWFPGVYWI